MTVPPVDSNQHLAARARIFAANAPRGSRARRAWLSVAVLLCTTTSIRAARAALADIGDAEIQQSARHLLDQLTSAEEPAP